MKVEKFFYNDIDEVIANAYVVYDDNGEAVVFDPSTNNDGIANFIKKHNLTLKGVFLTHGHFDHIAGVDRLIEEFKVPLFIHELEKDFLTDTSLSCPFMGENNVIVKSTPTLVRDNEEIHIFENDSIRVIHTPFHTEGSVCYYFINNKILISGDTLFKMSVGRSDLPTGNSRKMSSSLAKLKELPKETKIYPGHGPNTTLQLELMLNNFFKI